MPAPMTRVGLATALVLLSFTGSRAQDRTPLDGLRGLEGEWEVVDSEAKPTGLLARYASVAGGAAVTETLLVGTPGETVTTYHLEDGLLTATQVSARGRPVRLVPAASETPGVLRLVADSAGAPEGCVTAITLSPSRDGGRRVEWSFVAGDQADTRRFELRRRTGVEALAAEAARIRVDLAALQAELDRRMKIELEVNEAGEPRKRERVLRTLPGGAGWDVAGVPLRLLMHRQAQRFASTFAAEGDRGHTIAHFPFTAGPGCRVRLSVLGGHAYFGVVEETRAPPRRIDDLRAFAAKLDEGEYGAMVERIHGGRWAEHPIAVEWDLSRFAGKRMRLYLVDVVSDHYAQIAISEVSIHEDVPR